MKNLSVRLNSLEDDLTFEQLQRLVSEAANAGAQPDSLVKARTFEIEVFIAEEGDE